MAAPIRKPILAVVSGSERTGSFNKKLAVLARAVAEEAGADARVLDLTSYNLPLYSQDDEKASFPEGAAKLKSDLTEADGLLFVSPEFNGFLTPLLLNAITWATRGEGDMYGAFKGKFASVLSASPGPLGGMRSQQSLRQLLMNCGSTCLMSSVSIGGAFKAFNEDGSLVDEKQAAFMSAAVTELVHHARDAANREVTCTLVKAALQSCGEYGSVSTPE
jgi:chromate reductase